MHPFFAQIKNTDLEHFCRTDNNLHELPEPHKGKETIKAIVLGTDPTNDGIGGIKGLMKMPTVFGIGTRVEPQFWGIHARNLDAIGLNKENIYVQNVCRNYFSAQTSKNNEWQKVAEKWLPYLKIELDDLDKDIPVLVTAEILMKVLVAEFPKPVDIYNSPTMLPFFSAKLNRKIIPLYRHHAYSLSNDKWNDYKSHLKQLIHE